VIQIHRKKNVKVAFIIIAMFFMALTQVNAQSNEKLQSLMVYNFTRYIEWPSKEGDFVIAVIGNSPILAELKAIAATKKVGASSRSMVVKEMSASEDLSACQMVFVSKMKTKILDETFTKLSGKPILIIAESPGAAQRGAAINFVIVDDKLRFELNRSMTERQGLKVSRQLTSLAIEVK
jgi:roadblock/LC7 domain-containing protein